jgi:hypothetical protein
MADILEAQSIGRWPGWAPYLVARVKTRAQTFPRARQSALAVTVLAMSLLAPDMGAGWTANAAEAPGSAALAQLLQPPTIVDGKNDAWLSAARKWHKRRLQPTVASARPASRAREPGYRTVPLILGISF